ncbi:MAG TPA: DUF5615 family PIN-like protein [Pyrinomonadaceae bacterium]|nr:DUF5615 family PIN-like protein [Pyrinomonadaceae bacterium]
MRIKLDHNLSPHRGPILEELGHDVKTASGEDLSRASDALLLSEAAREERMLFTLDLGFASVDRYPRDTHAGIVVFEQRKGESIERVENRLLAFARSRSQKRLEGRTVVVEKTRLRFPRGKRRKGSAPGAAE